MKKDPNAELSEPVKLIVFYIDRSVPEKWWPYLKQDVEDWQVAFEQAGLPSTIENACGPHAMTHVRAKSWKRISNSCNLVAIRIY